MGPGSLKKSLILATSLIFIGGFFAFSAAPAMAAAGINKQINFQGKVVNSDGTNVTDQSYTFLFCIYTTASPASPCTSGALNDAIWKESKSLATTSSIFQTNLGDATALPSTVTLNVDQLYLGINFNNNGQMSPLVQFTAAPYAINSDNANNLESKTWEAPGTIGSGTPNTAAFTSLSSTGITNLASTAGSTMALGNSTGTVTLASGGVSAWANTAGNLTISTTSSGILALTSVGALNQSMGAASTATLANVTNALNFDSNTFSIDALNNRVGVGLNNPGQALTVSGTFGIRNGSWNTIFQAGTQSADLTYTLPTAYPTSGGYVLSSTVGGVMSWVAQTGGSLPSGSTGQTLRYDGANWVANSLLYNDGSGIGIGTAGSPNSLLELASSTANTFLTLNNTSTYDAGLQFRLGGSPLYSMGVDNSDGDKFKLSSGSALGTNDLLVIDGTANSVSMGSGATSMSIDAVGNVGIGLTSPTAFLHLAGATTSYASLRIATGTAPTTPNNGDLWYNGTNLYFHSTTDHDLLLGGGMTNPMTAAGDIIYGGTLGAPTVLPASGTDGWVLTYSTGLAHPVWAAGGGAGMAIGGAISNSPTTGSVLFVNSSGQLAQDNANPNYFFYDAGNHRLGLGTAAPGQLLTVNGQMGLGNGTDTTQALITFNLNHPTRSPVLNYDTTLFTTANHDGFTFAAGADGGEEAGYIRSLSQVNSVIYAQTTNTANSASLVAMYNNGADTASLAGANRFVMLLNSGAAKEGKLQYNYGTGAAVDAMVVAPTNGTTNDINTISFPNGVVGIGTTPGAANQLDILATTANDRGINILNNAATGNNYGIYSSVTGAATQNVGGYFSATGAATNYGLQVGAIAGGAASANAGLNIGNLSTTALGASTIYGIQVGTITSFAGSTGSNYGMQFGAISGAANNSYGISLNTLTGGTTSNAQITTGQVTITGLTSNYALNIGGLTGTANGSTNTGINLGAINTAGTTTNNYGLRLSTLTGGTTANYQIQTGAVTDTSVLNVQLDLGAMSGSVASSNNYVIRTGAVTSAGATSNNFGLWLGTMTGGTTSNSQITTGAITITGATNYGINVGGISSTVNNSTNYGINVGSITAAGTTTNNYGLNINAITGGTTANYGINVASATPIASSTTYGLNINAISGTVASATSYGRQNSRPGHRSLRYDWQLWFIYF